MQKKLTATVVKALRAPKARTEVRDTLLPGFGLRYWKSRIDPEHVEGSWFVTYRQHGRLVRHTIGSLARYSLAAARAEARELFKRVDRGEILRLPKETPSAPGTVDALIEEFERRYLKVHRKNPGKVRRALERELIEQKPKWKDIPVAEITRGDIHAKLDRLMDEGKEYAANRLLEAVRLLFAYAETRGYIDASPAASIKKPAKERPRDRTLDHDEIRAVWAAFESMGYPFGPFFKMLLLTGQREGEVATMTWSEVDTDAALWTIPAEKTKSGREHKVPLAPSAVKIIEGVPTVEGVDYLFCGRMSKGRPISGFGKAADRARQRSEIGDWRPHDLRRTVRTQLGELGTPPHIAELVLNHAVKGLQAVYDRYDYTKEKREALNRWDAHLQAILAEKSNVVSLR